MHTISRSPCPNQVIQLLSGSPSSLAARTGLDSLHSQEEENLGINPGMYGSWQSADEGRCRVSWEIEARKTWPGTWTNKYREPAICQAHLLTNTMAPPWAGGGGQSSHSCHRWLNDQCKVTHSKGQAQRAWKAGRWPITPTQPRE